MSKYTEDDLKIELENKEYEYGFYTDLQSETFPIGLNEDIVRAISLKKEEPEWMTDWRIESFRAWQEMIEPEWANVHYTKPDFQAISYYSAPKAVDPNKTLDDVDPELLEMYKKLGISVDEQKMMNNVAMDIVVDSVSVATTFKKTLAEKGIIFMSISEAIREYPELVQKYLGTVVPQKDNFYAALNSAVFSDGSFCYIPKGVKCPMELSTYFRINQAGTATFTGIVNANNGAIILGKIVSADYNLVSLNSTNAEGQYIGLAGGGGSDKTLYYQSGNAGAHIFRTGNGTTFDERMRITSGGNVGIGTTNPTVKLEVNGTLIQETV